MSVVDIFFPKKCVGCGRSGQYICANCRRQIETSEGRLRYKGVVRKILKEIKYRGSFDMVAELVEVWQLKSCSACHITRSTIVTAVPMWDPKQKKRGFNQAELIAKELAKQWGIEYREMLVRVRDTKPMYGLKNAQRQANIMGAFCTLGKDCCSSRIILVDDVVTSGATTNECKRVLLESGATSVKVVAISS